MPNLATMTTEETQDAIRTEAIAQQNDRFRRAICGMLDHEDDQGLSIPSGRIVYTQGIDALGFVFLADVMKAVAAFSDFSEENDPNKERDFAALDVTSEGQPAPVKIFWKIDYYADRKFEFGSEDPADLSKTVRVLTLLLPSEY